MEESAFSRSMSDMSSARKQHERHGLAHDGRTPHDHRVLTCRVDTISVEHLHDAGRRARAKPRKTSDELAQILRVKAVDVFLGIDRGDNLLGIEMSRQRHLHQDARDGGIGVQPLDERHELVLRRILGEFEILGRNAALLTVAQLGANIRGGTLIVADQHNRQTTRDIPRHQVRGALGSATANLGSEFLTVDNRSHAGP